MIDLVLCYSILEKCKSIDAFSGDSKSVEMVRRIRQHRMVISERLMEFYEEYFERKGYEWLEWYRSLCIEIFYTKERSVIVNTPTDQLYIKENAYHNELVAAAKETEDKMILMEPKRRINQSYIKKFRISILDSEDINDVHGDNCFSMYTLPVNGKSISEGENSEFIAKWLGRFLQEEDYIQIFDSYLLTKEGIEYLRKYVLKYLKENTDIEIYSLQNEDFSEHQIRDKFSEEYYKKWHFSIYIVENKKSLHARSIQGSKYTIQIDRGLSIFGRDGKTFQAIVNVFESKNASRIFLEESKLREIM